jgi:hypothetical protein
MSNMSKELETFAAWWDRVEQHHHRMSPFQVWDNGYAEGVLAGLQIAKEIYTEEKKENETTTDK